MRVRFFVFYALPGSHSRIYNYARPALLNAQGDTLAARTYKPNHKNKIKQIKTTKTTKKVKEPKTPKKPKNKKDNIARFWPHPYVFVFNRVPKYCFFGWIVFFDFRLFSCFVRFFWFSFEPHCSRCVRIFSRRAVRGAWSCGILLNATHKKDVL